MVILHKLGLSALILGFVFQCGKGYYYDDYQQIPGGGGMINIPLHFNVKDLPIDYQQTLYPNPLAELLRGNYLGRTGGNIPTIPLQIAQPRPAPLIVEYTDSRPTSVMSPMDKTSPHYLFMAHNALQTTQFSAFKVQQVRSVNRDGNGHFHIVFDIAPPEGAPILICNAVSAPDRVIRCSCA